MHTRGDAIAPTRLNLINVDNLLQHRGCNSGGFTDGVADCPVWALQQTCATSTATATAAALHADEFQQTDVDRETATASLSRDIPTTEDCKESMWVTAYLQDRYGATASEVILQRLLSTARMVFYEGQVRILLLMYFSLLVS